MKPLKSATMLASLVVVAGCALGYHEEFETIQAEPLADPDLLGLRLETATGSAGIKGKAAPYVFRVFENPDEPPLRLVERVKQVGVESGWAAEFCSATPSLTGDGVEYLLYLTKRESVQLASVTADETALTVKVEWFPGGLISVPSQRGEPAC